MTTLERINTIVAKYTLNGTFKTRNKTKLSVIFSPDRIPTELNNFGVYIFTEIETVTNQEKIVYIGKCGTLATNGVFGDHTLNNRIMQGKKKKEWFPLSNYKVYWYVTIKKSALITGDNIPSVVESELLKSYYELEKKLPRYNKAF